MKSDLTVLDEDTDHLPQHFRLVVRQRAKKDVVRPPSQGSEFLQEDAALGRQGQQRASPICRINTLLEDTLLDKAASFLGYELLRNGQLLGDLPDRQDFRLRNHRHY